MFLFCFGVQSYIFQFIAISNLKVFIFLQEMRDLLESNRTIYFSETQFKMPFVYLNHLSNFICNLFVISLVYYVNVK